MGAFIIAEAGVNHNGSTELALKLVDAAAHAGADAVKFQTFSATKLVRPGTNKAAYQQRSTGDGDQFDMLKALEMSADMHQSIVDRCRERGIEFMSTPFDIEAAEFLVSLGMKRIKVPSGEITNLPFLRALAALDRGLIVSTGMSTLEEICEAVGVLDAERRALGLTAPLASMVTVLHCTSNYPAAPVDVNLRAMTTIAKATGLPVGYSDHTLGVAVSTAAVALGATVIEKHFTLDKALPGPDHQASLTVDELALLVGQVRAVEQALGSPVKAPTDSELPVREVVRRSVTTCRAVAAGQILSQDDLCLVRPGNGIAPKELGKVVGKSAARNLPAGTTLSWSDLQ
jgi:N,N'-diacetyllegionaminate synthase